MTELQDKELNKLNNYRFTKLQAELQAEANLFAYVKLIGNIEISLKC
jgi:hypothetical protein